MVLSMTRYSIINIWMKPVLLYAMPRTKATACLTACKRIHQYDEPFRLDNEFLNRLPSFINQWNIDPNCVKHSWAPFLKRLNLPDTAIKIHSRELRLPIAKHWYTQVLEEKSHEIFVVERENRMDIGLSYMLIDAYGSWDGVNTDQELTTSVTVTDSDIANFERHIVQYINNFPTYGSVITFETAPPDFFNRSFVRLTNQKSYMRYCKITNIEWCTAQLSSLLAKHKANWDDRLLSLSK